MEVRSRKELKFYLAADMMMNRRVFSYTLRQRIKNILCPDYIMRYLNSMRKCSYYNYKFKNRHGVVGRIVGGVHLLLFCYYYSCYLRLGIKLGFSIGFDCFGYGVWLPHHGTIVCGENNRLGKYACLHTSSCITATGKKIGDNCLIATGAKLINHFDLGNNIMISANSVLNHQIDGDGFLLAGAPAKIKKSLNEPWWYSEHPLFREVEAIEQLKCKMGLSNL